MTHVIKIRIVVSRHRKPFVLLFVSLMDSLCLCRYSNAVDV